MNPNNIDILKNDFSGEIILPGSDGYESASTAFIFKGTPAIILRPKTTSDVAAAVKYAQSNSGIISIRSGGHSGSGFGTNNGGLVIDLSAINSVDKLDKSKSIVSIGAGATWKKVATILEEHGLALSSGDTTSVGVGGLTLGGGIGWMVRKYGLTIDSLIAAEVVTADGRILCTRENENPDLFWAIRGGGGNFGIVTNFEFTAHPLTSVFAGIIQFELDHLYDLLKGWRDYMRTADESLSTIFIIMPPIAGNPSAAIISCCYAGDDEGKAMQAIKPLQQLGKVTFQNIEEKKYSEILEEAHPPEGVKIIVKNGLIENLNDNLIKIISEIGGKLNGPVFQIRSVGGAMKRVDPESTAFYHRNSEVMIVFVMFASLNSTEDEIKNVMMQWNKISDFSSGSYVNFLSMPDEDIRTIYPGKTLSRLLKIKEKYDPGNLFKQNYNIKPSGN